MPRLRLAAVVPVQQLFRVLAHLGFDSSTDRAARKPTYFQLCSLPGTISVSSPIARGLIRREVGDDVTIQTPSGRRKFQIADIEF